MVTNPTASNGMLTKYKRREHKTAVNKSVMEKRWLVIEI